MTATGAQLLGLLVGLLGVPVLVVFLLCIALAGGAALDRTGT